MDIDAAGNIALSSVTTVGGEVQVTSSAGSISDNTAAEAANITASSVVLRADTGIGTDADDLDTAVTTLAAVTEPGDITVSNSGGLTIGTVDGLNGATITETHNGQTFEMTSENVAVEVTFHEVTEEQVHGLVTKLSGNSGTFTIRWVDRNLTTTVQLNNGHPEQLFGLEGGDGDKRETGEINH